MTPIGWFDFKFGVLLDTDRAYVVSNFGWGLISTICMSGALA